MDGVRMLQMQQREQQRAAKAAASVNVKRGAGSVPTWGGSSRVPYLPMTNSPPPPLPTDPIGIRLLFGAMGFIALGIGTIITLGAALAGVLSIIVAGAVGERRRKHLTRRGAWFASVGGTMAVLIVVLSLALLADQPATTQMTAAERAAARARAQESMPDWVRAMNPNAERRTAVADSMATRLLDNKAVMVWAGLMGAVIGSAMIGTIAGSFAWGGFMLLYRGARGHWLAPDIP